MLAYLSYLIQMAVPVQHLQSSNASLLVVPRTRTDLARHAFSVAAATTWNSLPFDIRACRTLPTYKNTSEPTCSDSLNLKPPARLYPRMLGHYTNVLLLLGRVTVVAQPPIVVKLSRGDLSICTYVHMSVGLSSALWKNDGLDLDAVWHRRLDGSRHEAGSGAWGSIHGKGYFWGRIWGVPFVMNGDFTACVRQRYDAALFPNYLGQTCYYIVI